LDPVQFLLVRPCRTHHKARLIECKVPNHMRPELLDNPSMPFRARPKKTALAEERNLRSTLVHLSFERCITAVDLDS